MLGVTDNREISFPNPSDFQDPFSSSAKQTVAGRPYGWIVTHSTRAFWQGKCNGKVFVSDKASVARYTYQKEHAPEKAEAELERERWGVMGYGKVGKLPSWARETEYGIEDNAGEVRGDWRATWAVLVVRNAHGEYEGMDLLASTLYNSEGIVCAVAEVCKQEHPSIVFREEDLKEVKTVEEEEQVLQVNTEHAETGGYDGGSEAKKEANKEKSRHCLVM